MKNIYVVTGQTATGKTSYAIDLAQKINGELINCDSRQIYKQLNIITGKELEKTNNHFVLKETLNEFDIGSYTFTESDISIWLYDIISPNVAFSTFDYRNCALQVIKDIISRDKTPIIVGGTYFYLKHLLYGTVDTFVEPNPKLREELNTKTVYELQNILFKINPRILDNLNHSDRNNPHRLIRKIEILNDDKKITKNEPSLQSIFPDYKIKMEGFKFTSKEVLRDIIEKRVDQRLENGAIEEVTQLLAQFPAESPGLKTIGYTQIINHLQKTLSFKDMKKEWILKELQYAKRQLTFMKKDSNIIWQEMK